ncbi:MAG: hypothetical protein AAFZ63_02245 [Bacteroidota bacterium]
MSLRTLQIANIIGFVLVIIMNTLANTLPINGFTTGELSALYPNLFVPAGFTFSIWGVIYLLLLIFVIYQMRNWWSKDRLDMSFVERIGPTFFVSCLANASWIVVWHYVQPTLSLAIMLTILSSLLAIYRKLDIGKSDNSAVSFWAVKLPFSVYLGWITVATIANVTTVLVHLGWDGGAFGEVNWTITMIAIATIIGAFILFDRRDIGYAAVLVWAFFGIYSKQQFADPANSIPTVALIAIGSLVAITLFTIIRRSVPA